MKEQSYFVPQKVFCLRLLNYHRSNRTIAKDVGLGILSKAKVIPNKEIESVVNMYVDVSSGWLSSNDVECRFRNCPLRFDCTQKGKIVESLAVVKSDYDLNYPKNVFGSVKPVVKASYGFHTSD
jgi:hypothetical protein